MRESEGQEPKGLVRSATEILLGRVAGAVLSLVFLGYFARVLPKPVLGLIGVQAALVMLAKIIVDLGLHFQVIREATPLLDQGRESQALEDVIAPATLVRLSAALALTSIILALGYGFIDVLQGAVPQLDVRLALPFATGHLFLKTVQYILTPVYFAQRRFWIDSVLDSGSATTEKLFAFAFFLSGGVDYFFAGLMVGGAVTALLAIWFLWPVIRQFRMRHLSFSDASYRLRAYFPRYQRVFFRRGLRQVDRLVIAWMLPLSQMANYHVARQGTQFLRFIVRGLADPLTVRLAADRGGAHRDRDRRIYQSVVLVLPALVALASPWLIKLIGGDGFADAWGLMAVLAISYIFYGLAEYQLAVIVMLGSGDEPIGIEAVAGLIGVAGTIGMIAAIGELGAPTGQLAQFALLYFGGRVVMRRMASTA